MKRINRMLIVVVVIAMLAIIISVPVMAKKDDVNTITKGEVVYSTGHFLAGEAIPTGFDEYGYNYQGHMFSGSYFNSYAGGAGFPAWTGDDDAYLLANPAAASHWAWPYRETNLKMKWNDAWISNVDRDGDFLLDRHFGFPTYIDSGAWLTNHQSGTYVDENGLQKWTDFVKIVALTSDDTILDGICYDIDGAEIGQSIWGQFALTMEVYNDSGTGDKGVYYKGMPGLGDLQ